MSLLVALVVVTLSPARAGDLALPGLVTDQPAGYTPNVVGGACYDPTVATQCRQVHAYARLGDTIFVGGSIDVVRKANGTSAGTFGNVFAVNLTSGAVDASFHPLLKGTHGVYDGTVNAMVVSPDGTSLFIGGDFRTVNGVTARGLIKWNLATNSLDTTFSPRIGADGSSTSVTSLAWVGQELWVGGYFTSAGGASRRALASLDPLTGAATSSVNLGISGGSSSSAAGPMSVLKVALSPNGQRAVIIGNFTGVAGQIRYQVAVLNVSATGAASLAVWAAPFNTKASQYGVGSQACTADKSVWVRDVDWSPDGTYFVLAGTGGGHYYPSLCDSLSRWPVPADPTGDSSNVFPQWINYTNADTFLSVVTDGTYVYAGGHQKSMNYRVYRGNGSTAPRLAYQDTTTHTEDGTTYSGEVHFGLAAVVASPSSGLAVPTWNAGTSTERGKGWSAMMIVPSGLLVGGDVSNIQGDSGHRMGYFPLP
jgi:WD40 repeat protein